MSTITDLLQPIKGRLNAATPGPYLINDEEQTVRVEHPQHGMWCGEIIYDRSGEHSSEWFGTYRRDAELIANIPTDQAKLIAALEAVVGEVEFWRQQFTTSNSQDVVMRAASYKIIDKITSALEPAA